MLRADLAGCTHCQKVYEQTGMVPVWCSYEPRARDFHWLKGIEELARAQLIEGLPVVRIPNRQLA